MALTASAKLGQLLRRLLTFAGFTVAAAGLSVGAVGSVCGVAGSLSCSVPGMCGHNAGVSVPLAFALLWPLALLAGPAILARIFCPNGRR